MHILLHLEMECHVLFDNVLPFFMKNVCLTKVPNNW